MSLPSSYQDFIHLSRYSRWLENENRRETWEETVDRYFNFFEKHLKDNHNYVEDKEVVEELRAAVLNLEVMPSMRALMTAGTALEREKNLAKAILQLLSKTANLVGQKHTVNSSRYSLTVKFQNGTCQKLDLLEQDLRHSAVERLDQNPLRTYSDSRWILSVKPQVANLIQSKSTISSVKLLKLWLLVGFVALP